MLLLEAQKLAEQIVKHIEPFCERIVVAGSIRRLKPVIRDVDLVLIPKPLLWSRIIATLQKRMDAVVLKRGSQLAQLEINKINIDIYATNPKNWEALLLIRTGSSTSNIRLSLRAKKMGLKLTHSGLTKDGKIVASTEQGIFETLGLNYVPPEERK